MRQHFRWQWVLGTVSFCSLGPSAWTCPDAFGRSPLINGVPCWQLSCAPIAVQRLPWRRQDAALHMKSLQILTSAAIAALSVSRDLDYLARAKTSNFGSPMS